MFIEKDIIDGLGAKIRSTSHKLTPSEQECVTHFERAPAIFITSNFLFWGTCAYLTLDFSKRTPKWIQGFGMIGISAGALASVFYSSQLASRNCIQVFFFFFCSLFIIYIF